MPTTPIHPQSAQSPADADPTASRMLLSQKLVLSLLAVLAVVLVGAGAVMVESRISAPPPAMPSATPITAPTTLPATRPATRPTSRPSRMTAQERAAAIAQIKSAYGLKPGQNVRLVFPPFPPIRQRFWGPRYSTVTFLWQTDDRFATGISIGTVRFSDIIYDSLYIPWWQVDGLDAVHWPPLRSVDVAWRLNSTVEQRLADLLDIIHQHTGEQFDLSQRKETRPCIIVHARSTKPLMLDPSDNRTVLVFTQTPWTAQVAALYSNRRDNPYPPGTKVVWDLARHATKPLDAPLFDDQHLLGRDPGHVPVAPDAQLNHTDSDYLAKLQRVVDNVNKQTGGDWRVEQRQVTIYQFTPAGL